MKNASPWTKILFAITSSKPSLFPFPLLPLFLPPTTFPRYPSTNALPNRTGFFHAPDGTTGNAHTGAYTLADGEVGNLYTGPHPLPSSTGNVGTQQTGTATGAATAEATGLTSDAGAQTATTKNGSGMVMPTATPTTGQGGTGGATATPAMVTVTKPTATSQKNGTSGLKACWVTVVGALGVLRVLLAAV
jgi:hypothetical protein